MKKTGVFGSGVDQPGTLELKNSPQSLDPAICDQSFLGDFGGFPGGIGNIVVDRVSIIVNHASRVIESRGVKCRFHRVLRMRDMR
jgi:hypothetical protein